VPVGEDVIGAPESFPSPTVSELVQTYEWVATPIGLPATWPRALKTVIDIAISSRQPMFVAWGKELTFLYNDTYAGILGNKHPEALGRPFQQIWPEIWDDIKPLIDRALSGESTWSEDLPLTLERKGYREDTWWTFSYSPVRDDNGNIGGMFCSCMETTAQVLAERQSTAERERLFEMSSDLFGVATFDGYLKTINPAWSRLLERSDEELLAKPFAEIIHPDDLAVTAEVVAALSSGEAVHQFHVRLLKSNGEAVALAWSAVPERVHADGTFYTVGRDISEDLRREEMLRQAQKMEAVGQLTGGIAHDFNNLLTVIRGSVDLLRRPNLANDKRDRYLDAIGTTADQAATLTGQLLAFARRQSLKPALFDACDALPGVADRIRATLKPGIALDMHIEPHSCFLLADRDQFETAIINIAANARDAMNGEGQLTIRAAPSPGIPPIRSHPPVAGKFISITITDTGAGIAQDKLDHIFEPFFSTKGVGKGSGLGLSQAIGFAKQSGGDISVESVVGQGSTFTLYMPSARSKPDEAGHEEAQRLTAGEGLCVLVVEDNAQVGEFATQALQELGYDSMLASDAATALMELERGSDRYHVVFSDVVMPGMNGVDLGREIARLYPNVPVILASGYSDVLAQNGDHGFPFLHKPYSVDQLSNILGQVADRERPDT
jgi:PAS domain S-box-containing protein